MSSVAVPLQTIKKLSSIYDPEEWKREVFSMLGNHMPKVNGNRVLCAVYIENDFHSEVKRPDGTSVKILKSDDQKKESIWQSKTMMVLALGSAAFVDTDEYSHYGFKVKPGDWVTARISNCSQIEMKKMPLRIIADYLIETQIEDPRDVTS